MPKEFTCEINGHLLKQPMRTPSGHVFEYATIKLWLETRGSICPLTGKELTMKDLTPDDELRTRIMRHHINRVFHSQHEEAEAAAASSRNMAPKQKTKEVKQRPSLVSMDDDLYDF